MSLTISAVLREFVYIRAQGGVIGEIIQGQ